MVGRVVGATGGVAVVVDDDGRCLHVPAKSVPPAQAVAVDTELLPGAAATIWVRMAFEGDSDPVGRVPGGQHLLTPAEAERAGRRVASPA
jgi:hypothetical protein